MRLGVIGYGFRLSVVMKELMEQEPGCRIAAVTDVNREGAAKRIVEAGYPEPRYYADADEMLASEELDGILIGTRCSQHTEMALKALPYGAPLFLEKPVATNMADWGRLYEGASQYRTPVVVSFPLRFTPLARLARELVEAGRIGRVAHVQAVNNVPYGSVYFHDWYRDDSQTGGLFLQKTTHDFDYLQYLIGEAPRQVCAVKSRTVFKGDKPAGLRCSACEERDCRERVAGAPDGRTGDYCCFSEDVSNEDSASAIVTYGSGMHASYSQNFFVRRGAAARGARLMGDKGTMEFDFYTGRLTVHMHHEPRTETHVVETSQAHFGGDAALVRNYLDVVAGRAGSAATLADGLLSALMCLMARESAETGAFKDIPVLAAAAVGAVR